MFKRLQPAPPSDTLCSRPPDNSETWFVVSCRSKRRRYRLIFRCLIWIWRLGDILSQGQIVPTAFLGRQIVPSDKMSHFLPRDKLSHQTNCPISSPETKCPTDALIKNHCSTGIFRETNCPIRQNVPLSPRRQNVPNYAMMHRKVAGKLLGHFVSCPTLSIWRPIPWAKVAHLGDMYWTYLGYILTTFWAVLGCTGRVIRIRKI